MRRTGATIGPRGGLCALAGAAAVAASGEPLALALPALVLGGLLVGRLRRAGARRRSGGPGPFQLGLPAVVVVAAIATGAAPLLAAAAGVAVLEAAILAGATGREDGIVLAGLGWGHVGLAALLTGGLPFLLSLLVFCLAYVHHVSAGEGLRAAEGDGRPALGWRGLLDLGSVGLALALGLGFVVLLPGEPVDGAAREEETAGAAVDQEAGDPARDGTRPRESDEGGPQGSQRRDGTDRPAGIGFDDEVRFGAIRGSLTSDETAVRLDRFDPPTAGRPPLYVRAVRFDRWTGGEWAVSEGLEVDPLRGRAGVASCQVRTGRPLRESTRVIAPGEPDGVTNEATYADGLGNRRFPARGRSRPEVYRVHYRPLPPIERVPLADGPDLAVTGADDELLQVPAGLRPLLGQVRARLGAVEEGPRRTCLALSRGLREGRAYGLSPRGGDAVGQVRAFLAGRSEGYCAHFATALLLLLRDAGIPARLTVGFHGGTPGPDGEIVLTEGMAHAWVEVPFRRAGWVVLDPTPPVSLGTGAGTAPPPGRALANEAASSGEEVDLLDRVRSRLGSYRVGILLGLLALGFLWLVRGLRAEARDEEERDPGPTRPPEEDVFREVRRRLVSRGIVRRPDETVREMVRRAAPADPDLAAVLAIWERARYGEGGPTGEERAEVLERVDCWAERSRDEGMTDPGSPVRSS